MKAIAFDFDGTLIDSMGMWRRLGRDFVESKGKEYTDAIHDKVTTMSLNQSSAFFKKELELPESVDEIFNEMGDILKNGYSHTLPLKEGAMDLVKRAYKRAPLVLATATNEEFLGPALERFGLNPYFQFIQTCNGVGIEKSDARFYDILAKKLGEKPEDILFFDDAHYAVVAAKAYGLYTIGVKDDSNAPYWDDIVDTADDVVDSLLHVDLERYF